MLWIARRATDGIIGHRLQVITAGILIDSGLHPRSLLPTLSLISPATLVTPSERVRINLDVALIFRLIQISVLVRSSERIGCIWVRRAPLIIGTDSRIV